MRRGNKPEIMRDEAGQILAVNLSSDFCAEHEWGIKQLKRAFGIPDALDVYGMARRKITICPETVTWVEYNKREEVDRKPQMFHYKGFVYRDWYTPKLSPAEAMKQNSELSIYRPWKKYIGDAPTSTTAAAWSESDFAFVSCDRDEQTALKEIFDNFAKLNIVLFFGGKKNPFENPGLIIAIADRIPQVYVDAWYKFDKEHHELMKEFAATGIEEQLKKAGCRYFALSPKRQDDGSIIYWLNPMDQDKNNYGWMTLQDLRDWSEGKGRIPMRDKVKGAL